MTNIINLQKIKDSALSDMGVADLISAISEKDFIIESCVIYRDECGDVCVVAHDNINRAMDMMLEAMENMR